MKITILKSSLLTSIMLMVSICTFASDFESDGIHYNILSEENRTVEVAKSSDASYAGAIEIPESVVYNSKTYVVTAIGEWAFDNCDGLTSVTIGNSVTSIGNYAFYNCFGLTSVTIPNTVTSIGGWAFLGCSGLTSVTIPNSVTSIGTGTFACCTGLTSVTIPNSVTTIEYMAFIGCTGLTSVTIGNSVTTIGDDAFSGCTGLTSVTIPNSVTSIGSGAFSWCSGLTTVTIPNSVISIGYGAFECSGLIDILVDENNQNYSSIDGVLYDKDATVLHTCPGKKESVTIPNTVTSIGDLAFSYCTGLTSVTLPSSVKTIGDKAFSWCIYLTSMTIPNSVTSIGSNAFAVCLCLTFVTIPNSVTTIGDDAFYACNSLTSIFCQATTPPTAGSMTSSETVLNNCTLYVPTGCKADYEGVVPWRNFLKIEEMDFAGIDTATTEAASMQLTVENGAIRVSGISEQEQIMVYNAQGRLVYSGTERTITNLPCGIYIVKAGSSTAKAAI